MKVSVKYPYDRSKMGASIYSQNGALGPIGSCRSHQETGHIIFIRPTSGTLGNNVSIHVVGQKTKEHSRLCTADYAKTVLKVTYMIRRGDSSDM